MQQCHRLPDLNDANNGSTNSETRPPYTRLGLRPRRRLAHESGRHIWRQYVTRKMYQEMGEGLNQVGNVHGHLNHLGMATN